MSTRTRTRNQGNVSVRYTATRLVGGTHTVVTSYPSLKYNVESITDDGDRKITRYKPLLHDWTRDTPFYSSALHLLEQDLQPGGLATMFRSGNFGAGLCHMFGTSSLLQVISPPTLASIPAQTIRDLFIGCLPSLNNGNSLVNFVLELRDVKSLTRTIANLRRTTSQLARRASQLKRSGLDLSRSAAEVNLSYQFGVAPFIRDVKKLYKTAKSLIGRIEWLEANHSKVLVRHNRIFLTEPSFSGGLSQVSTSPMTSWYSGPWGGGNVIFTRKRRWLRTPVLTGTLKYTYALTSTTPLKEQLGTYLSAFGVEANPKILWDAIPFTFLVDWVVDVGGLLGTFKIDSLGIQTTVIDYCYSVKWHALCDCWISEYNPNRLSQTEPVMVRQAERSYYERKVGTPSLTAVDVSSLGSREFLLGGSLVLAGSRPRTSGKASKKIPSFK